MSHPAPVDILAFGAHPDDVELGCGGTIAKEVKAGKTVTIVDLTQGELSTLGDVTTRQKESADATKVLGISYRENLNLPDGFFSDDKETILLLIQAIRKYQPKILLCNPPNDRHPDHGQGSKLVQKATFLSGLVKIDTNQPVWRPNVCLCYIQWNMDNPDLIVDITDTMADKLAALKAYQSQFYQQGQEAPTPIATKNFIESITYRAQDLGRIKGVAYGEGFITLSPPLVNSLFDLKA